MVLDVWEVLAARLFLRVAAYLEDGSETAARPLTPRVAAAVARNHKIAGLDVPVHHGVARTVLDELTRDDVPGRIKALPLDLDCYLAHKEDGIRAHCACRRRSAVAIAMIGVMRDATLRMREAAALTRGAR